MSPNPSTKILKSTLKTLTLLGSAALIIGAPTPALAQIAVVKTKVHENHYFIGVKGAYLGAIHKAEAGDHGEAHTEVAHHGGAGLFFELTLVRHWLELELSIKSLSSEHGVVIPIDILLKVPFHFNKYVIPYVGIGPAMAITVDGDASVYFGGASALGAYFWVHRHIGLLLEFNYNILHDHGLVHELGVGAGVVVGF